MTDYSKAGGSPPDPLKFEGPLNVFIQLQGTAAAYVRSAEIKQAYDKIVPAAVPAAAPAEPVYRDPLSLPISAGKPIEPDMSKYMIDKEISKRLR